MAAGSTVAAASVDASGSPHTSGTPLPPVRESVRRRVKAWNSASSTRTARTCTTGRQRWAAASDSTLPPGRSPRLSCSTNPEGCGWARAGVERDIAWNFAGSMMRAEMGTVIEPAEDVQTIVPCTTPATEHSMDTRTAPGWSGSASIVRRGLVQCMRSSTASAVLKLCSWRVIA
eukprot:scaffold43864_cov59-Phaeocystis_antarctica.AAC.14